MCLYKDKTCVLVTEAVAEAILMAMALTAQTKVISVVVAVAFKVIIYIQRFFLS